jgi:hypothetical protein
MAPGLTVAELVYPEYAHETLLLLDVTVVVPLANLVVEDGENSHVSACATVGDKPMHRAISTMSFRKDLYIIIEVDY